MAPPFTHNIETYCVCMDCGAHREFNLVRGKMVGPYYHVAPTVLYEPSAATTPAVPTKAAPKMAPAADTVKTLAKTAA